MGDCQLDDLLDMLDVDGDFEEATVDDPDSVDDPGSIDDPGSVNDPGSVDENVEGGVDEEEEMAQKLRAMEEEVSFQLTLLAFSFMVFN